jgi:hypothetical protein
VWSVEPDGAVILLRIGGEAGPFFVRSEEASLEAARDGASPEEERPRERIVGEADHDG